MPELSFKFKIAKFPAGFTGNIQTLFDKAAELLTGYIDGNFLTGQIGGAAPSEDVGVWVDNGQIKLWDEEASTYKPFTSVPPGALLPYAGATPPEDFLLCDGGEYQRSEYPTLFAAIGDAYGASSGLTFRVPDLRARYVVGAGAGVAYADASSSESATSIGSLRERVLGYFYGQEFARQETRGINPVTTIKNQRTLLSPSRNGTFTAVTPPSLGLHYIIRAR